MSDYVDPFEAFKKKKETEKLEEEEAAKPADSPAAEAPATPAATTTPAPTRTSPATTDSSLEFGDAKPEGLDLARAERQSAEEVQADMVRPKIEGNLDFQMNVEGLQSMSADEVQDELTVELERAGRVKSLFPDSELEVNEVKPEGMESHRQDKVDDVEPGETPAGFESMSKNKEDSEPLEEEDIPKKPKGFSKF